MWCNHELRQSHRIAIKLSYGQPTKLLKLIDNSFSFPRDKRTRDFGSSNRLVFYVRPEKQTLCCQNIEGTDWHKVWDTFIVVISPCRRKDEPTYSTFTRKKKNRRTTLELEEDYVSRRRMRRRTTLTQFKIAPLMSSFITTMHATIRKD